MKIKALNYFKKTQNWHSEKVEVSNLIWFTYQEASNILQEIGLLPSASGDTGGRISEQNPREGERKSFEKIAFWGFPNLAQSGILGFCPLGPPLGKSAD